MKIKLPLQSAVIGLALVAGAALAETKTISYSDSSPSQVPSWSDTLSVARFDSSLGTLTGVEITFLGAVMGNLRGESLAGGSGMLQLTGSALLSLSNASIFSSPQTLQLSVVTEKAVTGYDSALDYAGTSGLTAINLYNDGMLQMNSFASLASFIGTGTLDFSVDASGGASYRGPGTAVVEFSQLSDAQLTVVYTYEAATTPTSPVPEPETYALFAAGLGLMGWSRRRSASRAARA